MEQPQRSATVPHIDLLHNPSRNGNTLDRPPRRIPLEVLDPADPVGAITNTLRRFHAPGQVVELRAVGPEPEKTVESGLFHLGTFGLMASGAWRLSRSWAKHVWMTLHPIDPGKRPWQFGGGRPCTRNEDIVAYRWFYVDADPIRPADLSATDAEKEAAHAVIHTVRDYLASLGWPDPVEVDSGNGFALYYRIDLPLFEGGKHSPELMRQSQGLISDCLLALHTAFSTEGVKIDLSVGRPAQLTKVFGVPAKKGENTPGRPHRFSKVIRLPDDLGTVTRDQLDHLARRAPKIREHQASAFEGSAQGDRPGDIYNARGEPIVHLLVEAGWSIFYESGGITYVTRPGKEQGTSGTVGYKQDELGIELFHCFTDNAPPFEPNRSYTRFQVFTLLRYGNLGPEECSAAASDLRHLGFTAASAEGTTAPPGPAPPPPTPIESVGIDLDDLLALDIPEPKYVVEKLIPEGASILGGKPKKGKSFLMLEVALAIALGEKALGSLAVEAGRVLYLALEDGRKRLKKRCQRILESRGWPPTKNLKLVTGNEWPRMADGKANEGGLGKLREWLAAHRDTKLVIVDTLAKFRPRTSRDATYASDYAVVADIKAVADEFGVALVIVHHLRKAAAEDPIDQLSGTLGLGGAADTILVLERQRSDGVLKTIGREGEDGELALEWMGAACVWNHRPEATDDEDSPAKLDEARTFLRRTLANGPLPATEVRSRWEAAGLKEKTVRRAKDDLGIRSIFSGKRWAWSLRDEPARASAA
jgi:hypothetical protein